jgi:hypothetical protein
VSDTEFPVETYKEAARHLRRPFTQAAVKFKVQATWPKDNPTGGLIVAYIDARLTGERLNLVVPHLWHDSYRPVGSGQMWCDLTIDGITRSDVGEGVGKALVSDSFKRAGVKFGIGVSLYAIPKMILDTQSGALKQKRTNDGLTLELTPRGETILRNSYAAWLEARGTQAFGEPLDHGDAPDAMGDAEDGNQPVVPEAELSDDERERRTAMEETARRLVVQKIWTTKQLGSALVAAGATDTSSVSAALLSLTDEQAAELRGAMDELLPKATA